MRTKFLLFVIVFSFVFSGLKAQVDMEDSLALVDLYNSTGGAGWKHHKNWLTEKPLNTWYGVELTNNHVTGIYVAYNRLNGMIPESIGNFDSLLRMQLGGNNLSGTIPNSIGNLKTLEDVFLSFGNLTGPIPNTIGSLTNLYGFQATKNKLTGSIPESLGKCNHLSVLELDDNKLTGSIPLSFKGLTELTQITLSSNQLSGTIPDAFSPEAKFYEIWLQDNKFSGSIPAYLGKLPLVKYLSLARNKLTGPIPEELGNIGYIETLDLSENRLTGGIPKSFAKLTGLTNVFLTDNQLYEPVNAQATGRPDRHNIIFAENNRFTFNGLEYLAEKYPYSSYGPQASLKVRSSGRILSVSAGGTLSNNTYTWFQVGKGIKNNIVGDSTFTPTESGSYYCTVTNKIATQLTLYTDTVTYITNPVMNNEPKLTVSPNPAREMMSIHGLNGKSNAKITVADMNGYIRLKAISHQQSAFRIDVSQLKAGNYLVSVSDGKEVKTIQFVKE